MFFAIPFIIIYILYKSNSTFIINSINDKDIELDEHIYLDKGAKAISSGLNTIGSKIGLRTSIGGVGVLQYQKV